MKYNKKLKALAMCFGEIEELMAIISEILHSSNIPFKAMFVEHWPVFTNDPLTYKIWNGIEHIKAIEGLCAVPTMLTSNDILEIVKRKEILMRKFS
jgi:hypothetical protein